MKNICHTFIKGEEIEQERRRERERKREREREREEERERGRERREGSSWMKTVEHFAKQTNRKYVGGKTTQGRHGQEERRFSLSLSSFLKISLRVFNHSNGHVLYTKWYLK